MKHITQPGWMRGLPGDSYLNRRDMYNLFGYSSSTSVTQLIDAGSLPKPTYKKFGNTVTTLQWKISEVREFIKEHSCKTQDITQR